jgi:hypothetical protein
MLSSDFTDLLQRELTPAEARAELAVVPELETLAEQALAHTELVSPDPKLTVEAIIAEIDLQLSEQINLILHHPEFQQMEAGWRGLYFLVASTETDMMLKIKLFSISKRELGRVLRNFRGTAWDQSPIFKKIYEEEYGQLGGEPYGLLVGDYYFDQSPGDVQLLADIAQTAAAAHAPLKAGNTSPGARCARARIRAISALRCRASSAACPTAPAPIRSMRSCSKRMRKDPTPAAISGRTPPTPWPRTSPARSRCTAGARASAASIAAGWSTGFPCSPSRPPMGRWIAAA